MPGIFKLLWLWYFSYDKNLQTFINIEPLLFDMT